MEQPTVQVVMAEKLLNFQERFHAELSALPPHPFTVDQVLADVIVARPVWQLIENKDWDTLLVMLESAGTEALPYLEMYASLNDERRDMLQRYVFLFYKLARQIIN